MHEGRRAGGKTCGIYRMRRKGKKNDCSSCSVAELGMRLVVGLGGKEGMVNVFS